MSRVRDIASILTASSSMATDTEVSAVSAQIPTNVAGKNAVINGNFDIWQRGTSFSNSTGYSVDRFTQTVAASGSNVTVTRETTVPNPNSIYSVKYAQVGAATSIVEYATRYWPETQDAMRLAGKTVTLSFWYRSNKTGTHGARMSNGLQTGGADAVLGFNVVAANTWQYITWTTAVPYGSITAINTAPNAGIGILDIGFKVGGSGPGFTSLSDGDYFQLSQVQLEIGSTATPFSRAGGTIGGELALCHRYYWRDTSFQSSGGVQSAFDNNVWFSLQNFNAVPMRATPTAAIEGSPFIADFAANLRTITSVNVNTKYAVGFAYSSTKLTSNLSFGLNFSDAGRALSFSAEL